MNALLRKVTAVALCAILLCVTLAGCGTNATLPAEKKPMGAYVEESITPPGLQGIVSGLWTSDNGIDCLTMYADTASQENGNTLAKYELFHSDDQGKSWSVADTQWIDALDGSLSKLSLAPGGSLFALTDTQASMEAWHRKDGATQRIEIEAFKAAAATGATIIPNRFEALGEDRFFISYMLVSSNGGSASSEETKDSETTQDSSQAVQTAEASVAVSTSMPKSYAAIYHLDGTLVRQLELPSAPLGIGVGDKSILFVDYSGTIARIDAVTGEDLPQGTQKLSLDSFSLAMDVDADSHLYLADTKGLVRVPAGGSLFETVLEGSMYSFGSPAYGIDSLRCLANGDFVMALSDANGSSKLFRYYYDESVSSIPEYELTVWSLRDNPTARAAITLFHSQNKDTRINYEVAITDRAAEPNIDGLLRTLNTELLSGSGPDVLILDGVDYQSYQQKGMLADLSQTVDTSGMYANLLSPFQEQDGLFVLPAKITIPALIGAAESLGGFNTLDDIVTAIKNSPKKGGTKQEQNENSSNMFISDPLPASERPAFTFSIFQDVFDILYSVSAPAVLTAENGVDHAALKTLLESFKQIYDKNDLSTQGEALSIGMTSGTGSSSTYVTVSSGMLDYFNGVASQAGFLLTSPTQLRFMDRTGMAFSSGDGITTVLKDSPVNPTTALAPLPGLVKNVYHPMSLAAINANSKQTEKAGNFIAAMLTGEIQSCDFGDGLPVTTQGLQLMIEQYNRQSEQSHTAPLAVDLNALIAKLTTPVSIDSTLSSILLQTSERYCKGTITLDEAVKAIVADTELSLAER